MLISIIFMKIFKAAKRRVNRYGIFWRKGWKNDIKGGIMYVLHVSGMERSMLKEAYEYKGFKDL